MEKAIETLKAAQATIQEDIACYDEQISQSRAVINRSKEKLKALYASRDQLAAAINKLERSR